MPIRLKWAKTPDGFTSASIKDKSAFVIASGLFTGLFPASGTWGALLAFLLHNLCFPTLFTPENWLAGTVTLLAVIVVGVWSADVAERMTGLKDDSRFTIDEVAGYFVAVMFVPAGYYYTIPAFILCRVFDIIKPPPADRLQSIPGGWGVMIDDLIASLYAVLILHGVIYLGWL